MAFKHLGDFFSCFQKVFVQFLQPFSPIDLGVGLATFVDLVGIKHQNGKLCRIIDIEAEFFFMLFLQLSGFKPFL